ncbi:MAG: 50S ribosomal protein L9 [Gammaproteobacteria bacterium]|jgi:large subunit ribosomal protein L9
MEVILLEKIENLGGMGDKVRVRPGYGRNYLIPQGKAAPATPANIAAFEARRAELEQSAADALAAAQARAGQLVDKRFTVKAKAGDEGKLFGSVGTADIERVISDAGIPVERHEVRLPTGAFRQIGEYEVQLHLHTDVDVTVMLVIEEE